MELRWKQAPGRIKSVEGDGGARTFSGYMSTPARDRVGDIVRVEAFRETLANRKTAIPVLLNHDHDQVLGKIEPENFELREDGVFVKRGDVLPAGLVQRIDEVWSLMKFDALNAMSFGFKIEKSDRLADGGAHEWGPEGLDIQKLDLYEATIATVPANPGAELSQYSASSPIVKAIQTGLLEAMAPRIEAIEASILGDVQKALPRIVARAMAEIEAQKKELAEEEVLVRSMSLLERGIRDATRFDPGSPRGAEA